MRRLPPGFKLGVYALEGLNTFACAYYGNYLLFLLRDRHGFGNAQNLTLGACHGLLYVGASLYAGKFGQRRGYFTSLRVGFAGMALAMLAALLLPQLPGQLLAFGAWTVAMCFTWPMLEALVSEHAAPAALPHRLGLYNLTWASISATAYFTGGMIFERVGASSLYWLPASLYVVNFIATFPLARAHDAWLARQDAVSLSQDNAAATTDEPGPRPRYFLKLAWLGNPFAYMAINTFTAVVPGIAKNAGLTIAQAGMVMSVWFIVRAGAFVALWAWHGWHYKFRWFISAFGLLIASFVTVMLAREIWLLVVAQVFFGCATGLIYYSSLFYSMDGSETKGEHGGTHEALIGAGICGGPAIGALSLWVAPAAAMAPAIAVGAMLVAGLAGLMAVRWRKMTNDE
ncbi:MAG: MFS transporter [Verrucomicrobia bacterium]|nr:MFS transporter [Verrucomicrobiota bacterium]